MKTLAITLLIIAAATWQLIAEVSQVMHNYGYVVSVTAGG